MADPAQALTPEVDDGFTPEERAQFEEMQKAPEGDSPPPVPDPAPVAPPAPPVAAEAGDDDDDDEDASEAGTAPAAAPKLGADGKPEAQPETRPKKRVSARKYERSEAARQAAEDRANSLAQNQARLDERLRILNEALSPQAQPQKSIEEEDPEPDAEKDVFAWISWKKRDDARLREEMAEMRSGRQAETEDTQLANAYTEDARSVASQDPNFVPAYQFLMANRTYELAQYFFQKDLTEQGVQLTPDELGRIRTTIANEEKQLAREAIANHRSPAKAVLALAKARGYRPAPPAAAPVAGTNGAAAPKTNGAAPAVPGSLAAPGAAPNVAAEIANIRAGSEASRSLSSGGGAPANPLTPEKIANMSEDEFSALVDSLSPAQHREMFGD